MYLGRVVGCVWSAVKNRNLEGERMLVIQPLTPELANTGQRLICTDCTGAGAGELIYWVRGREASFAFLPAEVPSDATIVGIVDELNVGEAAALGLAVTVDAVGAATVAEALGPGAGSVGEAPRADEVSPAVNNRLTRMDAPRRVTRDDVIPLPVLSRSQTE